MASRWNKMRPMKAAMMNKNLKFFITIIRVVCWVMRVKCWRNFNRIQEVENSNYDQGKRVSHFSIGYAAKVIWLREVILCRVTK